MQFRVSVELWVKGQDVRQQNKSELILNRHFFQKAQTISGVVIRHQTRRIHPSKTFPLRTKGHTEVHSSRIVNWPSLRTPFVAMHGHDSVQNSSTHGSSIPGREEWFSDLSSGRSSSFYAARRVAPLAFSGFVPVRLNLPCAGREWKRDARGARGCTISKGGLLGLMLRAFFLFDLSTTLSDGGRLHVDATCLDCRNNSVHVRGGPCGRCLRLTVVLLHYNDRGYLAWVMTSSRIVLCSRFGEIFIRAVVCSDGLAAITLLALAYHDDPNFVEACRWRRHAFGAYSMPVPTLREEFAISISRKGGSLLPRGDALGLADYPQCFGHVLRSLHLHFGYRTRPRP